MCIRDRAEIGHFARVDNRQYRLLKAATPGPWTFILEATKEVPRRVSHPSRKTIGIRVPDHAVMLGPVSYTHLDVYKRQARNGAKDGRAAAGRPQAAIRMASGLIHLRR